jgi:outer membrane lipoprotein LolB
VRSGRARDVSGVRRAALLALAVVLAGCAGPKPIAGTGAATEFSRTGRFALTVNENDGKQSALQGGFSWLDDGRQYTLDLTNPLGSTEARVQGNPIGATLRKSDGTTLSAPDPDTLAEDALGSPIPVAGMRDWLRGRLPGSPPAQDLQRDDQGHPAEFAQGGWHARLSRYDDLGPRLLVLERDEAGRRILLRLVVDSPA